MIKLIKSECYTASMIGVQRRLTYLFKEVSDYLTVRDRTNDFEADIHGAGAEMTLAKFLGIYWDFSVNTFKKPDVGGYQVRHTRLKDGRMIIREEDSSSEKYALVIGELPSYEVIGWINGCDAKQQKFWSSPNGKRPCWWIPQNCLNKFTDNYKEK